MQIYVDADACPVIRQVEETARKYKIKVTLLCDTSHMIQSDYSQVKVISQGTDAVDFTLVNLCRSGDIVVTQDYGVAAMALGKGALGIHQSGRWYTNETMDTLLMERHIAKEARRASSRNHLKGPKKRTAEQNTQFQESLERLIRKAIEDQPEDKKQFLPTQESVRAVLETLNTYYGTTKEPFYHHQPWQLLLAIMLSAQSTDKQVDEAIPALFDSYHTAADMAAAPIQEIEGYICSMGLYKTKARNIQICCRQIVEQYNGQVPDSMEDLLKLAGVGRKTATLYLADAHGIPGVTVDTHVFRISKRLGWASGKNPQEVELELQKVLPEDYWNRINFQLIYHGRTICTARKAHCEKCPLETWCAKNISSQKSLS